MDAIKIAYYSRTGNVKSFVSKLGLDSVDIESCPQIDGSYVLITPTYDFGQVPEIVAKWLRDNHRGMEGVIVSGNRNWGALYGQAGECIASQYDVPLLAKFELRGTDADVERIKQLINEQEM